MFGNSMMMGGGASKPAPVYVGNTDIIINFNPLSVPYPSGMQNGDLLVLLVFATDPIQPIGWTRQPATGQSYFLTKFADGSEIGSLSISFVAAGLRRAFMCAYRGVGSFTWQSNFNAVNTLIDNTMIVYSAFSGGDTNNPVINGAINTDLMDFNTRFNQRTTSFAGGGFLVITGVKQSVGNVQAPTITYIASIGDVFPTMLILAP